MGPGGLLPKRGSPHFLALGEGELALGRTGAAFFLEFLHSAGVRYLFGNPGTTELPINEALLDVPIKYILGVHEIPVVSMADGYAQASRQLGVVNVHISCGLGNAMGMIYNAFRAGTPLLITAGQQDQRFMHKDPILWGDMVGVVRPWTKWAAEVRSVAQLPLLLQRAIQTALTPPTGPVFLSLPLDVQLEIVPEAIQVKFAGLPRRAVLPSEAALSEAACVLRSSQAPCIVMGSKWIGQEGIHALARLAEQLGAPVFHEPYYCHGRCNFPPTHPLAAGLVPFWAPAIRARLETFDAILAVGVKLFEEYLYHGDRPIIPESAKLIHIDDDPYEVNKNYPAALGLVGELEKILIHLAALVEQQAPPQAEEAARRREKWQTEIAETRRKIRAQAAAQMGCRPLRPLGMLETLARVLPPDVVVVEEAPTTSGSYFERVGVLPTPEGFFAHKGWALGWGVGCAIGVRLAWPNRPVLALLGDGAALYGIQALWTAAHYGIPVTFVVANNRQYGILKSCARELGLPHALAGQFCGLDLESPAVDFLQLAGGFGVAAYRVASEEELAELVREALAGDRPVLIEVPVEPTALDTG